MRRFLVLPSLLIFLVAIVIACSKGNSAPETILDCSKITNKDFSADINPIIQSTCNQQGCHDVASTNGPGPLTNYAQFFNARSVIRPAIQSGLMPQNSTLTNAQKNSILCWIDSGAPNN
jgi:hypothetical protein